VVTQRELGTHTLGTEQALRAALRESPDMLIVGELRDYATISVALSAAETGVLVLGVLNNTAILLALAFSGWAFHQLVRQRSESRAAGILAGVLAPFSSHQMFHLVHLPLLVTGWIALFLLGLHGLVERPSVRSAALCGTAFAMTALTTGYYGAAAALVALVFAAVHARHFRWRPLAWSAAAIGLAAILLWPYAHGFMELRRTESALQRPAGLSAELSFDPARDLKSRAYVYRRLSARLSRGAKGERMFPGLIACVLAGVALLRRGRDVTFYAAAVAVLLFVSLGPRAGAYSLLRAIPPFDSMRHPWSFAAAALLLFSVLAGIGWSRLRLARRPWAGPVIVTLAVIESLGPPPRLVRPLRGVPAAYERLRTLPPGPILEVPVQAEATMLWAARHGLTVLNGSVPFMPARTTRLRNTMKREWLEEIPADLDLTETTRLLLEEFGLRYLLLPTGRQKGLLDGIDREGMARLAEALERSRAFSLLEVLSDGDRLYEVRRPAR
jgi:hypothetical protein